MKDGLLAARTSLALGLPGRWRYFIIFSSFSNLRLTTRCYLSESGNFVCEPRISRSGFVCLTAVIQLSDRTSEWQSGNRLDLDPAPPGWPSDPFSFAGVVHETFSRTGTTLSTGIE